MMPSEILTVMDSLGLPAGINFYSVDNKKLFEIRGPIGRLTKNRICYLIKNVDGIYYRQPIQIEDNWTHSQVESRFDVMLNKFISDLELGVATRADINGGNLGLERTA